MKSITNKTKTMKTIENKEGVEIEEILRHKFVDENKSTEKIAQELNISYLTCFRWLQMAGIHSRMLKLD
jgi:response regulator of citrate/malate metabolism